jgi:hypothetical protein
MVASSGVSADWLLVRPLWSSGLHGSFVFGFRLDRETLLLRLPTWPDFLMAIPLAFSFVILSDQLDAHFRSRAGGLLEQLREVQLRLRLGPGEWIGKLATIGAAPRSLKS